MRLTNSLTWKFKRVFIVVENELGEDAKAFIIFKKIYLRNLVGRHRRRGLQVLDANKADGGCTECIHSDGATNNGIFQLHKGAWS